MRLHTQLLTNNNCYKAGISITPKGVMWHSTGANNPNLRRYVQPDDGTLGVNSYGNHWNQSKPGGAEVCVHAFIGLDKNGAVATYQTLPWDMRGWHAGGAANNTHISFEICEDALVDKDYFNRVYAEACELTAYLCKLYELDPMKDGVVICHSEGYKRGIASNHADVMHWFKKHGKTMDDARRDVKALMGNSGAASDKAESVDNSGALYRVQCGAFKELDNAKNLQAKLTKAGYDTYLVSVDNLYKVQCGAFANKSNADALAKKLEADGYDTYITTKSGAAVTGDAAKPAPAPAPAPIKKGDKVRINKGAKSYDGVRMDSFVYDNVYPVDELSGDRAVLGVKSICTAFNVKDLTKV